MLPQELVDVIIDFNHNDQKTLACCSLVCRGWIPSSRRHLFSSNFHSFHRTQQLFVLIKNKNCTIIPFIHRLVVNLHNQSWLHDIFPQLSSLPALKTFSIVQNSARCRHRLPPHHTLPVLPHITHLNIYSFVSLDILTKAIAHLPALEHLDLSNCDPLHTNTPSMPPQFPTRKNTMFSDTTLHEKSHKMGGRNTSVAVYGSHQGQHQAVKTSSVTRTTNLQSRT